MQTNFTALLVILLLSSLCSLIAGAGYTFGLGFSPVATGGFGNYGFGYPYSPYGFGAGPMMGMGMGGFGFGGAAGSNFNDWTLRSSAYGLGYGFPLYGR